MTMLDGSAVMIMIEDLIKKHGRRPDNKQRVELSSEHNARIIGILFAALPADGRAHLIEGLDMLIAEGICPALIGLLGKGTTKGVSGVWPLLMPLAPYADKVLAE